MIDLFRPHRRISSLKSQQLLMFAVVITAVVALTATVVVFSTRYSGVFGASVTRYFAVHRLRQDLTAATTQLDLYMRTSDDQYLNGFYSTQSLVHRDLDAIQRIGGTTTRSRIEISAIYYGLHAFDAAATDAVEAYENDEPGYYFKLEKAQRYRGYVDNYLGRLFGFELESGQEQYQSFLYRQRSIQVGSFVTVAAIAVVLLLFGLGFSRTITLPISHLAEAAQRMSEGNLEHSHIDPPANRELQVLTESFTSMNASIRELVRDLQDKHELQRRLHEQEITTVRTQRLLREAQLEALQAQINPHFLFNTLNSIARTAGLENAERSNKLILSLATVLRYILRNPGKVVTIKDELAIIEEYLHLHQVRFPDRLKYEISCSTDAQHATVPRLTLQPLVENAIRYGIEPNEAGGTVTVAVGLQGVAAGNHSGAGGTPGVEIRIADDGMGMSTRRLAQVRDRLSPGNEKSGDGMGLENVSQRLFLIFGDAFRLEIESRERGGTTVVITIPLVPA